MGIGSRVKAAWAALTKSYNFDTLGLGQILSEGGTFSVGGCDPLLSATVRRAITRIGFDMASCPIVFEVQKGNDWTPIEPGDQAFGDIAGVFQRANPAEGRTAMWTRFHMGAELSGVAVLLTDYMQGSATTSRGRAPRELRVLRSSLVEPVYEGEPNELKSPTGYKVSNSAKVFRPDEILYHILPNPNAPWTGLSPTVTAAIYAKLEQELPEYTLEYFKNGTRGSIALETDATPNDEQRKQLDEAWQRRHAGDGKRFRALLLTHGLKAKELNGRRDTDFADLFGIIKEQVSMIYGVPLALLSDLGDSGVRANLEEQTPQYVEGTLFPKGALFEQNLTEIVCPRFVGPQLSRDSRGVIRARLDWDKLPMVQRMLEKRAGTYFTLVGGPIITPNEARDALHMKPLTSGDQTYPQGAQPAGIGPVQQPRPVRTVSQASTRKWIDDPARHAKRIASGVSLDRFEKPAEKMVRAYFTAAEARALHAFEQGKSFAATKAAGDLYDEEIEIEAVRHLVARMYGNVLGTRGPEAAAEGGGDPSDFLIDDPEVRAFLEEEAYANGKRIVGTTAELLRQAIATAHSEGMSVQETATMIRDVFGGRRSDALTIARTETVRAYNFTTFQAYKQVGVERVSWLTAHDDAVRDSHREIDGEERNLGDEFSNGCKFPGDPSGEASETINCRCVLDTVEPSTRRFRVAPNALSKLFPLTGSKSRTDTARV